MSSVVSREVYAGGSVYSATKHALDAIHRSLRLELLPWNIRLTSINPGLVETEFSLVRFHGDAQRAQSVYSDIKPLQAEDVADAVAYCLGLPAHVNIPELHITAACQASATRVRKEDGSLRG
jgi:NADP-dependent 3-hydroxy acid dehydrogenase YdfG